MASTASANEFAPSGTYSVRLGSSFTSPGSKGATSYYTFKFNSRLDPTMSSRKAKLEKADNDTYSAEWDPLEGNADSTQLNYDATPSQAQEVDCILLFDEATQTFSLQRPSLKFTMRKSRKRKVVKPQLPEPKAPKKLAVPEKRPAGTSKAESTGTSAQQADQGRRSSVDDFTKDLEKDMADILDDFGDDDDDDDDDDDMQSVTTAPSGAAPSSDTDTFEEVVVPTAQHQQQPVQQLQRPATDSPASMNRKRKYKMASQPIRRLDDSPAQVATPPPPATASSSSTAATTASPPIQRREFGGKSISSAAALAASRNRKAAAAAAASVQSSSESSSGSSSSGESGSSSSGESGSSTSGSEDESSGSGSDDSSDDDDMDDLLADINRDLSADSNSVPPSPNAAAAAAAVNARSHTTPVVPERSPYSVSPAAARGTPNRNGGPVSLRALFNDADHGEEDEGITSSDSESDGD